MQSRNKQKKILLSFHFSFRIKKKNKLTKDKDKKKLKKLHRINFVVKLPETEVCLYISLSLFVSVAAEECISMMRRLLLNSICPKYEAVRIKTNKKKLDS